MTKEGMKNGFRLVPKTWMIFLWRIRDKGRYRNIWRVWDRQDPNMSYSLYNSTAKKIKGRLDGKALYIDTENTFRPERIVSISQARNLDPKNALENIIVAKAYNSAHQELIIEESGPIIDSYNVKLLIVDSAVAHYRAEFLGRAALSERQQKLNKFMHVLIRIAETYGIVIVVTNQILSSPDAIFGDAFRPTGGHVVAHTSTYRVYLKKAGKNRIARIVDSPYHAEREVLFTLSEEGVTDPS